MKGKRVLVVGGGVAGLTVAHECREAGAEVVLCERSGHWGGKVLSYRLGADSATPGAPVEHSMRTFSCGYFSLFETMQRIPHGAGSAFDTVTPVAASMLVDGRRHKTLTPFRVDSNLAYPEWRRSLDLCRFLRLFGAPWRDIVDWSLIVCRFILGNEAYRRRVAGQRLDECLELNRRSDALATFVLSLADIVFAAKRDASAAVAIDFFARLVLARRGAFAPIGSFTNVTRGPVNECFIDPWVARLQALGVEMRANSAAAKVEFDEAEARAAAIVFADGARIEADAFVLAVTPAALETLLPQYYAGSILPKMRREWSAGMQFFLRSVPETLGARDSFFLLVGSPWAIIYMIEGDPLWRGVDLPEGMEAVLSVTISSFDTPGIVHGKAFWACDWEEVQDEILAQIGLTDRKAILGAHMDSTLRRMSESEWLAGRDGRYRGLEVGPAVDGQVWTLATPLWIYSPESGYEGAPVQTPYQNVFVAGEFTATHIKQPTMEKASQAGKLCAAAVLGSLGLPYDTKRLTRPPRNAIDTWLYR